MPRIDLLIANELPLHREVLVSAFRAMRPGIVVHEAPHDHLESLICEVRPLIVICSAVYSTLIACVPAWITLFPDDRDEAIVLIDGIQRTIPNASLHQLVDVVDEVRALLSSR